MRDSHLPSHTNTRVDNEAHFNVSSKEKAETQTARTLKGSFQRQQVHVSRSFLCNMLAKPPTHPCTCPKADINKIVVLTIVIISIVLILLKIMLLLYTIFKVFCRLLLNIRYPLLIAHLNFPPPNASPPRPPTPTTVTLGAALPPSRMLSRPGSNASGPPPAAWEGSAVGSAELDGRAVGPAAWEVRPTPLGPSPRGRGGKRRTSAWLS
jgi:hypothetical protein